MKSQIAAVLMLKNENRYIRHEDGSLPQYTMLEQCLRRVSLIAGSIYVVDNGSTDGSYDLIEDYADVVWYQSDHLPFDDVRDRTTLLRQAKRLNKKWMLVVDGDEILEDRATAWIHNLVRFWNDEPEPRPNVVVNFDYINFWRSRTRYRTDAWYGQVFPRLFTVDNLELVGGPLHNYRYVHTRNRTLTFTPGLKVLHYGWADWEHRLAKTDHYTKRDAEINRISYQEALRKYARDVDETGLTLKYADPAWASEFRTGVIDY